MKKILSLVMATALFIAMSTSVFANEKTETTPPAPMSQEETIELIARVNSAVSKDLKSRGLSSSNLSVNMNIGLPEPVIEDADAPTPYIPACPQPGGHTMQRLDFYGHILRVTNLCDTFRYAEYSCSYCKFSYNERFEIISTHVAGTNGCPN